jgi:hypothetical protein
MQRDHSMSLQKENTISPKGVLCAIHGPSDAQALVWHKQATRETWHKEPDHPM